MLIHFVHLFFILLQWWIRVLVFLITIKCRIFKIIALLIWDFCIFFILIRIFISLWTLVLLCYVKNSRATQRLLKPMRHQIHRRKRTFIINIFANSFSSTKNTWLKIVTVASSYPLYAADDVHRVGEAEGRPLHVRVHLEAEVLEALWRCRHDPQVGAEPPGGAGVRLVAQQTPQVLLRRLSVVLLDVRPYYPVLPYDKEC